MCSARLHQYLTLGSDGDIIAMVSLLLCTRLMYAKSQKYVLLSLTCLTGKWHSSCMRMHWSLKKDSRLQLIGWIACWARGRKVVSFKRRIQAKSERYVVIDWTCIFSSITELHHIGASLLQTDRWWVWVAKVFLWCRMWFSLHLLALQICLPRGLSLPTLPKEGNTETWLAMHVHPYDSLAPDHAQANILFVRDAIS
jgi:hypothetical protein